MKLEVFKSYTLAILVGISLILSFSLWNYQPKDDSSEDDELLNEEQIDLGGTVETRKSLVQPTQIIFEDNDDYYGFTNPVNMQALHEDMTSWVLYNLRNSPANGRPNTNLQVEVIFPTELPMTIIPTLFTVNDIENANGNLPENLYFQRMYITFDSDHSLIFSFLSTDGKTQVKADVNNAQKYDMLRNYINTSGNLDEYMVLQEEEFPIYLPVNSVQTSSYWFNVSDQNQSMLEPEILRNALFLNPSSVLENVTEDEEIWYHDGQRMMQVSNNKLNMEFVNPQEEALGYDPMTSLELLDTSIARINGYMGWVQDYQLETLDTRQNLIRYQMNYRGYPVFNHDDLSTIEQIWGNNELEQHRQPLYKIYMPYSERYDLNSGEKVIDHLKSHASYNVDEIEAIQAGYRLGIVDITDEPIVLSLTPSWYIKANGHWERLIIDEELPSKGVN